MDFHTWIDAKYKEWSNQGDKSADAFAVYLGLNGGTVGTWLRKTRGQPRSKEIIEKLVEKYGSEVYDVLGYSVSKFDDWDNFMSACRLLVEETFKRGLSASDPKFKLLVVEVFGKFGLDVSTKD